MGDSDAVALSVSTGSPRAELSLHELRVLGVLLQGLLEALVPEENLERPGQLRRSQASRASFSV